MPQLFLSTFAADVTPPIGHPLCGGWIEPVRGVDDPLNALGVVLMGVGKPVVLCAVDWCGLRNDANLAFRQALADAAHTAVDHVAVHCVHPHDAPFVDAGAQKLLDAVKGPPSIEMKFFEGVVRKVADACRASQATAREFTHVGVGSAVVSEVASNRRVVGPDGQVKFTRTSTTKDAAARAAPAGLIDPVLRTLTFGDGKKPLAALHYYATHPMARYGEGRVSADFCGLARQRLQDEDAAVFQVYFTGCAGNVTAGKYNDGAKENRTILRDRMHWAMRESQRSAKSMPVAGWDWRVESVKLPPRREEIFGKPASEKLLADEKATAAKRVNAAFQLAWLARQDRPIDLTCLDFGPTCVLHLPGEPFVEYQLAAQWMRGSVMVAGYGDGGPGYIPNAAAYLQGGYEPTVALAGPDSEEILLKAMRKLLAR